MISLDRGEYQVVNVLLKVPDSSGKPCRMVPPRVRYPSHSKLAVKSASTTLGPADEFRNTK